MTIENTNLKAAQDVQHKLEFYLVALVFTVAGFTIQTGKFTGYLYGDMLEVCSWVSLVLSGVIGLWRLENIPPVLRTFEYIRARKDFLNADPTDTYEIAAVTGQLNKAKPRLTKLEKNNRYRYLAQKGFMCLGFLSLLIARVLFQIQEKY